MSWKMRVASILVIVTNLLFYFVNCSAGGLPDNLGGQTTGNSLSSENTLAVTVNPVQIAPTQYSIATASGGTPPYTYSILSGTAHIDTSGTVTQASVGSVEVQVKDAAGNVATALLNVATTVAPSAANCTTPWGVTVASGSSVPGYATASVDCPSTAACTPVTLTCTNGVLAGANLATASNTCAYRACLYKTTSSNYGCISGRPETIANVSNGQACDVSQYLGFYCSPQANAYGYATELQCVGPDQAAQ